MYYNYIILGVLILIPFCLEICCFSNKKNKEASNDFSNEEKEEVQKKFMFSPEKRGERLFLYFIYLFPLIISAIRPGESGFNIFDSIKSNMSFYATALTITFAVYSFLKTQNATEKERIERDKQREDERTERENKDFILREKELEAERDYYRPIFVIENKKNYPYKKQVKLLMKDDSLYLENVMVHYNSMDRSSILKQFKSGEIINQKIDSSFYISAQTLIGETILFGYLDNGIKIYKYLKNNKDPQYPTLYDIRNLYNQEEINNVWGSYNTTVNEQKSKYDPLFLYSTWFIRENLSQNRMGSFNFSLSAETTTEFFRAAFRELEYFKTNNEDRTFFTIKEFINIFIDNIDYLYEDKVENKTISEINISEDLPEHLKSKMQDLKHKKLNGDSIINIESLKTILDYIDHHQKEAPNSSNFIIRDLKLLFSNIEFDSAMDINLLEYKNYLLDLTLRISKNFPLNFPSVFTEYILEEVASISMDDYC